MLIIGAGLGSFMQVATLAVQNSVARTQLGTATSSVTFFRSIGSALGGAVFGTILLSRLNKHLAEVLPQGAGSHISGGAISSNGTAGLSHLPAAIQTDILTAFVNSFHDMFLIGIPFAVAAFVTALFLRETPLRGSREIPSPESDNVVAHSPIEY
jgi:hypothetical protein